MSGRKSQLNPYHLVVAGDMSGSITSSQTNIQYLDNVGVQFVFTGTPTGNFFVDLSIDNKTWTPIIFSGQPAASGSDGNVYLDINQVSAPYIRVRYVVTSGSGTLDVWITSKQV
jgi:hypothetical protein